MKNNLRAMALVFAYALVPSFSSAVTFVFDVHEMTIKPGQTISVGATIKNPGVQTATIDGSTITIVPTIGVEVDDLTFLLSIPDKIDPDGVVTGSIDITAAPTADLVKYTVDYSLLGHYEDMSTFDVPDRLAVNVQAVPEPTCALVLLGGLALLRKRR